VADRQASAAHAVMSCTRSAWRIARFPFFFFRELLRLWTDVTEDKKGESDGVPKTQRRESFPQAAGTRLLQELGRDSLEDAPSVRVQDCHRLQQLSVDHGHHEQERKFDACIVLARVPTRARGSSAPLSASESAPVVNNIECGRVVPIRVSRNDCHKAQRLFLRNTVSSIEKELPQRKHCSKYRRGSSK
jgi:hypothetical protein